MTVVGAGSGGGHVSEEESAKCYVKVSISCTGGNSEDRTYVEGMWR